MASHLDALENQSVFILREAYHAFKNIAMPWSMGKDSNVLVWLANKAFFGRVPFPVLHIDTTYEFSEMLEFREWATKHYKLTLIVGPKEAMYTAEEVAMKHYTSGEVMVGNDSMSMGGMSMGAANRHLEVHVASRATGKVVTNVRPTITLTDTAAMGGSAMSDKVHAMSSKVLRDLAT